MTDETEKTYAEHLQWCKDRAFEYCDRGDYMNAYASFSSDMGARPETANHPAIILGTALLLIGDIASPEKMRRFIQGFN